MFPVLILTKTGGGRTAVGTHLGTSCCRDTAGKVVGSTYRKRGHQLFNISLTQRTFYPGIAGRHEPVKFVVAVFAVIFIYGHDFFSIIIWF